MENHNSIYGPILNARISGFTLIEIIVSMAIFAIITAGILGNLFSSVIKGRDAARKNDLSSIQRSLEAYYNDHRAYPTGLPSWGGRFDDGSTVYMSKLPKDPKGPGIVYSYFSDGASYRLYACLENIRDPKITGTPGYSLGSGCGGCPNGYINCNYGVSSPNTLP